MTREDFKSISALVEEDVFKIFPQMKSQNIHQIIIELDKLDSKICELKVFSKELFLKQNHFLKIFWLAHEIPWEFLSKNKFSFANNLFFEIPKDINKLEFELKKIVEYSLSKNKTLFNLSELKKQNIEFLKETTNLEKFSLEKIQIINDLKSQEVTRSKKSRDLVQFIKNLIIIESLEDLLELVRQEFKKFHNILPPIFLTKIDEELGEFYYFQGKQVVLKSVVTPGIKFSDLDPKDEIAKKFLIEFLQRPVSNVLSLPLSYKNKMLGVLFFENQLNAIQMQEFIQTLAERTYPIEVTMDRFLQQDDVNRISLLWAKTFDDLDDPILIVQKNFEIVRSNKAFGGQNGKKCYEVLAGASSPCLGCPLLNEGAENNLITINKKIFEVKSTPFKFSPLKENSNFLHHYRDVTKSKELQGRIIQGEKMAAIGLLAGNIAHELNNPLTGIKSMAELLVSELSNYENIKSDLKEVITAAERCHKIIQNLLDFSKDKTGKSLTLVDLNETIKKTLPLLKTAMRFHNCELNLIDQELKVLANPYLLQQVIFNLVNNACQSMGESGVLSIKTEISNEYAVFSIADDGPGVPLNISKAIFDPFFTTKHKEEGTGLGLSMSLSVIESFNGKLYLNPDVKKGAEFIIELPLAEK